MTESTAPASPPKARTYSGVPAEERTRLRRERIIEAAIEVFGQIGYAQTTMRDICGKARLAERYFYESFNSTQTLFEAVYQLEVQKLITAISSAVIQAPLNERGLIQEGVRAFLNFIKEDPRRVQIILIDGVWMDQMKVRDGKSEMASYVEVIQTLTRGFHPEVSPAIDISLAATGLIAMAIHTTISWARSGFAADVESVLHHNMYAWAGLNHWMKATHTGSKAMATRAERHAWVQDAFKDMATSSDHDEA